MSRIATFIPDTLVMVNSAGRWQQADGAGITHWRDLFQASGQDNPAIAPGHVLGGDMRRCTPARIRPTGSTAETPARLPGDRRSGIRTGRTPATMDDIGHGQSRLFDWTKSGRFVGGFYLVTGRNPRSRKNASLFDDEPKAADGSQSASS